MKSLFSLTAAAVVICVLGCGRSGPKSPGFDAEAAAQEALQTYDKDADGSIAADEAATSPALKTAFDNIDADKDGRLSAEEIQNRIVYYRTAPTIMINGTTAVQFKGKPIRGARVVFEPEPFLGDDFKSCEGVTNDDGIASVALSDTQSPGIYLGLYTVRITKDRKGKEYFPSQFNADSELGFEANDDEEGSAEKDVISFDL